MDKVDLPLVQGLVVDKGRKRLHGRLVIQLYNFPNEQAKGRITVFPGVILLTAQFTGQNPFQFPVVQCSQRNIVRQLVDSKGGR